MILVQTAHFTTNIVQLTYKINLQKKKKEKCKRKIDIDHVKAAAWDKVIAFIIETFEGFDLHEVRKYIP